MYSSVSSTAVPPVMRLSDEAHWRQRGVDTLEDAAAPHRRGRRLHRLRRRMEDMATCNLGSLWITANSLVVDGCQ